CRIRRSATLSSSRLFSLCAMPSGAGLSPWSRSGSVPASGGRPRVSCCALPIAAPGPADRRPQDASHQPICEFPVTLPAMIFEPAGMRAIGIELGGFDAMMLAADHAPQPCEVALCKIGVSAVEAVSLGRIDPFHREGGGEHVPVPKIVGGDHAAPDDAFSREGNAIGFQAKRPSQRPPGTLPQRHDPAPLVRPVLENTPIDAVGFAISLADMATE